MNSVALSGTVASQPRCTYSQHGDCRCGFILAVQRAGSEARDYIPVVSWQQNAETVRDFAGVGEKIEVQGELRTRKDSEKKWVLEVRAAQIIVEKKEVKNVTK